MEEEDFTEAQAEAQEDTMVVDMVKDITIPVMVKASINSGAIAKIWKVEEITCSQHRRKHIAIVITMTIEIVGLLRQTTAIVIDYLMSKVV